MPKGIYKRSAEQIQAAKERMKNIGKGRKGKKKTDPHAQPMEEVKPKPPEEPLEPTPEPTPPIPEPEKPIEEVNKEADLAAEEEKKKEEVSTEPTRPLTGPEIRKQQEESGKP